LNVPPGKVVEAIVFKLARNYELRIRKNENGKHRRSNVQWKL